MPINIFKFSFGIIFFAIVGLFASLFFNDYVNYGNNLFWLLSLGLGLVTIAITPKRIQSISLFDIVLAGLLILAFLNFYFLGSGRFKYHFFWIYIGYLGAFYLFYFLLKQAQNSYKVIANVFLAITLVALIQSGIALLQYFGFLKAPSLYFKLLGNFTSPNTLAAFLGLSSLWCVSQIMEYSTLKKKAVIGYLSVLLLFIIVIVISKARATWLGLIIGITVFAVHKYKLLKVFMVLSVFKKAVLLILGSVFSGLGILYIYLLNPNSVNGRGFIAKLTLEQIKEKPIFGHGLFSFTKGFNTYKSAYFLEKKRSWDEIKTGGFAFSTFNDYLNVLYESGIVGFLLLFSLVVLLFRAVNFKSLKQYDILAFAMLIMVAVFATFSYPLKVPHVLSIGIFAFAILRYNHPLKGYKIPLWVNYSIKIIGIVLALAIMGLSIHKIYAKRSLLNYFKSRPTSFNKQKVIQLYQDENDLGYSKFYLGRNLIKKGYSQEGIYYQEQAIKEFPLPLFANKLIDYYIKTANYKRAEELLKFNIGNEPFRFKPRMQLANLYEKSNQLEREFEVFKALIDLPAKVPSKKVDDYKRIAANFISNYTPNQDSIHFNIKGKLSYGKKIYSGLFNRFINYRVYLPDIEKILKPLPVIYIVDGQQYLKKTAIVVQTDRLINNHIIKPVALVFIDSRDATNSQVNRRHEYLICNNKFTDFFIDELLPYCEENYPISNVKEHRTILGHSLGGLYSSFLGYSKPGEFKNIAMQSPWFKSCPPIYEYYKNSAKLDLKMYMSFGTGEDTQDQDFPMIRTLYEKGYKLKVNQVEGADHNWDLWKSEIEDILLYFYKK